MSNKNPKAATLQLRELRRRIGSNINRERLEKQIPLKKLAKETHIPCNDLDYFEMGRGRLGLEKLSRIADIMNVELSQLITGKI